LHAIKQTKVEGCPKAKPPPWAKAAVLVSLEEEAWVASKNQYLKSIWRNSGLGLPFLGLKCGDTLFPE
jgi:hypothetical protein